MFYLREAARLLSVPSSVLVLNRITHKLEVRSINRGSLFALAMSPPSVTLGNLIETVFVKCWKLDAVGQETPIRVWVTWVQIFKFKIKL